MSASRTRQAYHVLTGMLDDAVKDGLLVRNPALAVDLPRLTWTRRRYLRHEELHALANACGPYRTLVLTLGYSGMRWGEVAALRVHHIDLARARIEVSQSVGEINGRIVVGTPKSHQTRWLPVPKLLLEGLEQQLARKAPDDLVFPSPQGAYLRVANFRRGYFDRAAASIGQSGSLPARAAAHRCFSGHRGRGDREVRPADARARLGHPDPGPLRPSLRRRTGRRGRSAGRRHAGRRCGPDVVPSRSDPLRRW